MDTTSRFVTNSMIYNDSYNSTDLIPNPTTPSTLEVISNEIIDYFDTHREQIPLLVIVYLLTIIWILYLILYHSRIQGIILSYILRRFFFKDSTQIKFDSFSISFISGAIMFRNLHYTTGSYFVFVKDGCLVFRYWSKTKTKPVVRLKMKLYHLDIQFFSPIRSSTLTDSNNNNVTDDVQRGSINGISSKGDDTQSVNTIKSSEDGLFVKRLRNLFPAIEIKVEHGRISAGHDTLPYGLLVRFSAMTSTFTSESPSRNPSLVDLMTLVYHLKYRNLRIQLYPIRVNQGEAREIPPPIPTSKPADSGIFQVFECLDGELEYEQDVPGKMIELPETSEPLPELTWEFRIKCNKDAKVAYGPWADRQREALWQYFFPTLLEDCPVTPEPTVGQTRIFKTVRFKLWLSCPTIIDLYFMSKMKLNQIHAELPIQGSYFEASFPFSTNPDGFDTTLSMNIKQPTVRTNLSFTQLCKADEIDINVHIHYPRMWNSIQIWTIDLITRRPQVYFVFEHKCFFQALLNDWSSSVPPDIYSFVPFIYDMTVQGDHLELLIPCNQGNWIDCTEGNTRPKQQQQQQQQQPAENNYISVCTKSFSLTYPLPFVEFCPKVTPMDITIDVHDVLARLVIPESNRMYYILEGIDSHKRIYTPNGIKSQLNLSDEFEKRDGCFDCGTVPNIKILIEILLHPSPPIDTNRSDLQYVQYVKNLGNRQTFHPNKLDYDLFNIEIDIGPVDLFLHGLFLKKLWWVKENIFGWDQIYHDIREPELIREKKIIVHDDPLVDIIDETHPFDPRYFRPLMATLRVALHNITAHLVHHTDNEPCPMAFCERLCFEMTTDLDETKLQVFFLPVNVYVEDTIVRNKSDQHLSTGCLQLSGLVIRGHAMLSHEGLPPERETLEYAWQMEIILGKITARVTSIQVEKLIAFLKNFYLQIMEDEYTLVRSPVIDKAKWIEKLKYDVLRFSLDSVDLNLVEVGNALNVQIAPVRLCMCNMHTSSCNESLTIKVGTIQIRQLLRLYPGSWLEAGSLYIPELRINAKFECHPPTIANVNEQLEFLRRHDQHSQRLHFLYNIKPQQTSNNLSTSINTKRPSNVGLTTNLNTLSCACLGGSLNYYTLVQGEQFFKSTFRLSEQSSFGRSLFRPDVHVLQSHEIFGHKYDWYDYEHVTKSMDELDDEEIFYPFDFCAQPKQSNERLDHSNDNELRHSMPADLYSLSRTNSARNIKHKTVIDRNEYKRSSSSIPFRHNIGSTSTSDDYLTPKEQLSLNNSSQSSLNSTLNNTNNILESSSLSSLTILQRQSSTRSSSVQSNLNLSNLIENKTLLTNSSRSTSSDSLTALEEILQRQQARYGSTFLSQNGIPSSMEHTSIPQPSLPSSSWISLRNQMKMPIPKSTLLCTTYIRYLSHYRSSTWSNIPSFPPDIHQDQIDYHPILDFNCVSQGFSCSFLSEISPTAPLPPSSYTTSTSRQQQQPQQQTSSSSSTTTTTTAATSMANANNTTSTTTTSTTNNSRPRLSIAPTTSPTGSSNVIATEKEICLRFIGAFNILLTPLMLECLTTYIEKWKTFDIHPISILDGLHFQAQTQSNPSITSYDLSATKISLLLPKINVCLLQAGLAEDNVQLTELRTPVDIVTMSLFALSCKQIQMETILSKRDQSTAGVFKIQSITGQFRRFENDFSSIENVNIHAIQSQRCRLQFRLSNDIQTHLPIGDNRKNFGFVMNEFGLQRLCFKLINNAAKQQQQQQQRKLISPTMTQIDETQTTRSTTKHKSKRKQSNEPILPSPSANVHSTTTSSSIVSTATSSSSIFDGSIDHVWISFPEPPHHTHSTSKRPRTSTTSTNQQLPTPKKLFSYTRYDWNFLSTLSPTVLGWFCVINRIQEPMEHFLRKREKRVDAILAYFLIETTPSSTLSQSKFYELFTPKTKYLLAHPVCQLVSELRKHFNKNTQIHINLQPNLIPELQILKQGIREACRGWAQAIKQQPHKNLNQPVSSSIVTSPTINLMPANNNDQEQPPAVVRAPTMVNRVQRFIGHEFVMSHPRHPLVTSIKQQDGIETFVVNGTTVRRRVTTVQKPRSNINNNNNNNNNNRETLIEIDNEHNEPTANREHRRTSGFLAAREKLSHVSPTGHINVAFEEGDAIRRFEPTVNVNNTNGYKRLSVGLDESDFECNPNNNNNNHRHEDSFNETTYYTDVGPEFAGPVEQLFKILLEYAGVQLSVTSSIEPLFEKLGQKVLASAQIKRFDVKILPNEPTAESQSSTIHVSSSPQTTVQFRLPHLRSSIFNTSNELSILSVTNLNIQSVCRQSLEHDQLHSANVQAGIRVQRVQQEVNLSFIRLVYQFYTVVGNALEYTGIDEVTKSDTNTVQQQSQQQPPPNDSINNPIRSNTMTDYADGVIQNLVIKAFQPNILRIDSHHDEEDINNPERQCWKKLRELVAIYGTLPEVKQVQPPISTATRKQQRSGSQPPNENVPQQNMNTSFKYLQTQTRNVTTNVPSETLLLSSFGWLIIDEIYYAASLGGLKVDGCMGKVQGSVSLSQRLRALSSTTRNQNTKKYDGSLIVQIGSTSLSLKETLSTSTDNLTIINSSNITSTPSNAPSTTRQISVLDIIVGKSRALTSLQTRGINLTLSGVTNIGTIAMDVPLRPQEVHDLVNRAGRLITSYVQEFLPDDTQQISNAPSTINTNNELNNPNLNDTTEEPNTPTPLERRTTKKRLGGTRRKSTITSNVNPRPLEAQQSVSSSAKRSIFEAHITAHCQGMTFSTTLLSTLKAQYKIGVVEGVANIGGMTSRFTAIIHEHALHFLNNNNNDHHQPPTVSSDNHVRIDFPQIRCYGNYSIQQEQENKTKGHLNLLTKIDLLKLTITADFLAQLVFVSKVIIHEINEILAKVSGFDQFHFRPSKNLRLSPSSGVQFMNFNGIDTEDDDEEDDDDDDDDDGPEKDQQTTSTTPFTYKIDISMKGFEVIGQTPSNTIVKFENGDKKVPIFIKLTNYHEQNSLLLYNKPLINASLYIKLSLGQLLHTGGFQDAAYFKTKLLVRNSFKSDDPEKEAYFIRLTKPSFYWQPGAIDKGILFWLNYKNTYEHWNEQRGAFTTTTTTDSTRLRSIVNVPTSPATNKELNIMFQLHIVDLGIAIPLQQYDPPTKLTADNITTQILNSQQSIPTLDESSDFLVFTLDKTTISACSCGAIISSGSFEGFCFRFAEDFQQTNKNWKPTRSSSSSNIILNACCVPSGQYLMHSRAKNILNSNSPKWYLNVQWDMKGIDINIDSIIGKRFSQLIRTITSTHLIEPTDNSSNDNDSLSNGNLINTQAGSTMNIMENLDQSEDDERIKRLEYEHLILGHKIETLKRSQVPYEILKPELARYEWLEKELLHTVKSEIQQKMKKQSNKSLPAQQQIITTQQQNELLRRPNLSMSGHSRDRNRLDSPSHKRTRSQDNGINSRHSPSDLKTYPSSIREDETEKPAANSNIRFSSQDGSTLDDHISITTNTPNEITSAPAVDLELNVQIQIASGSCNLYTRRDLISNSSFTTMNTSKQQQQQQQQQSQTTIGAIVNVNKIEYQVSQFSLPGVDVDAHYNSKHNNTINSSLNKRASFYCRAMIQSPTSQITIHPLLLDFLEQTLEHVTLPRELERQTNLQQEQVQTDNGQNSDNDHLNTMFLIEDQSSTTSFPIDVVVSLFIQPSVLLFTCLPTHPMECELRLPTVDVVFSSKRALPDNIPSTATTLENDSEQIIENSLGGLSFSLYMKDFKLNVYHPFSGESKVHLFEDIRSGQLQTRNALAVSVQSVSFNISRTRCTLIERDGELLNSIQLSVIGQISKAQFEYDIRRFSEILTFPKIWYNRSLARRLFLGDENLPTRISSSTTIARPIAPIIIKTTTNKQLRKEARVLLAIQLKELQISMRMSNVMGKVEWNTSDVCSTGSLTLTSDGQRAIFFSLGLQKSIFQAEQGIVGGNIRLKNLRTTGLIRQGLHGRTLFNEPSHVFDVLTNAIEIRLDYMGSPTLMGRISHILLRLKDDHHGIPGDKLTPPSTLVLLNLEWSQLHLMITRSTTPDIIKMAMKLTEFFNAQLLNSKNLLASIQYDFSDGVRRNSIEKKPNNGQSKYDTNIIRRYIGMHGGELMLQGHNLTLVVFHGLNFKSRQWALFSLNEPQINFVTDRGENGDINQKLFFYLGHQGQTMPSSLKSRTNMASISKVTRNSNEAPSHMTINEWFNYASSTISAVGLRDFPSMDDVPNPIPTSKVRSKQYEQNAESIFILPGLELSFQTRQLNGEVYCSFETEFYEHIMFTFNAEHFYFLHDLISSYIKEKAKALTATTSDRPRQRPAPAPPTTAAAAAATTTTTTTTSNPLESQTFDEPPSDDMRRFHCPDTKWKLQPTIKLLTAYGNEVEPFGADYILQKLGFRHARLTIPKWLQRGVMDPCEQSMTVVQLFLIFLLPERFKEICMRQ